MKTDYVYELLRDTLMCGCSACGPNIFTRKTLKTAIGNTENSFENFINTRRPRWHCWWFRLNFFVHERLETCVPFRFFVKRFQCFSSKWLEKRNLNGNGSAFGSIRKFGNHKNWIFILGTPKQMRVHKTLRSFVSSFAFIFFFFSSFSLKFIWTFDHRLELCGNTINGWFYSVVTWDIWTLCVEHISIHFRL